MSDLTNHYKERYLFYKGKCHQLMSYIKRFQKLLEEPDFPTLPSHSPSLPKKECGMSPILGGNSKYCSIRKRLNLEGSYDDDFTHSVGKRKFKFIDSDDSSTERNDDFDFKEGANKWECIPFDELDSYMAETAEPERAKQNQAGFSDIRPVAKTITSLKVSYTKEVSDQEQRNSAKKIKINGKWVPKLGL